MNYKKNINSIAVIASAIIVLGGLVAVPSLDQHQAHALDTSKITKFDDNVKDKVRDLANKIFNRGLLGACSLCPGDNCDKCPPQIKR